MIGSDSLHQPIDINVTERDVLELSGADALCAFFARLGYDTLSFAVSSSTSFSMKRAGPNG